MFSVSKNVDVAFLLFTSNKINARSFQYYKDFMKALLDSAEIDGGNVKVAAAAYRKRGSKLFDFNSHTTKSAVNDAIDAIPLARSKRGSVASGLQVLRTQLFTAASGDRPDVPNVVILITDANSNHEVNKIQAEAQKIKTGGNQVFVVGLGVRNVNELKTIASSDDLVYAKSAVPELEGLEEDIISKVAAREHYFESSFCLRVILIIFSHKFCGNTTSHLTGCIPKETIFSIDPIQTFPHSLS